jgi:choline dehydrogenase-like flavoprotein
MTADASPDAARSTDEIVDVLIIGAGASGAAVAWSLAETRMKILCLGQGDWIKSSEFPSNCRDWEARRYTDFDISPNRRARDTDYPINDDDPPMKIANFNGVGGGTVLFTAHYPRMHPSDFGVRTLHGVADDWPIDYWTLEPHFAENDRMTGVAGLAGDPAYPLHQPNLPPVPLGKTGTRYARAMNQLGHWWPSDIAVATMEYDGRGKCINLGHCTPGCAQGAKASVDITYWPHALRARVELRTRCRVREITTNEHGMASGVIYYDPNGVERFQPAEVVVLAANGIGTPRLLLNSASTRFPTGLANSSGLVSKNPMLHPWPLVFGYVDEELRGDHQHGRRSLAVGQGRPQQGLWPIQRSPGSRTRSVRTCQGLRPRRVRWALAITRPPILPSVK